MKLIKYVEWLIAQQGPHQTGPKQVSVKASDGPRHWKLKGNSIRKLQQTREAKSNQC